VAAFPEGYEKHESAGPMSKMYEALRRAQQDGSGFPVSVESGPLEEKFATPESEGIEPSLGEESVRPLNGSRDGASMRQLPILVANDSAVILARGLDQRVSEQYRLIRTKIVQHPAHPKMLIVTSPGPGDGKTVSSLNIAGILALRDDANVLLIEADFRRPTVSNKLGLPNEPGLANCLSGSCTLQDAIIRVEQFPNLYVLPVGKSVVNPAELLDTERWESVCAKVRGHFDYVILDTPPIGSVADYALIEAKCDGVIVVVRPDHTDRSLCIAAFEQIPTDKRLGVVMNCVDEWFLWKTNEFYYYGSRFN
jgi:capsular exopolysaccharide synthesis family protein